MIAFGLWRLTVGASGRPPRPKRGVTVAGRVKKGLIPAEMVVDTQAYRVPRRSVVDLQLDLKYES